MHSELSTVEVPSQLHHTYSIIWLHGLGADGHDFESIVSELHLHEGKHIRFIFPNAPIRPVTINNGVKMCAWYDILEMSLLRKVDTASIYQSAQLIQQLIQREINAGISSENILLAGFSQGGVIALHAGLRCPHKLGGIIALSTYLPTVEALKVERSAVNDTTPIFMAHGIIDSIVDIEIAKEACNALKALNYPVEWHDYLMEHSVCIEEIHHISAFINAIFKTTSEHVA